MSHVLPIEQVRVISTLKLGEDLLAVPPTGIWKKPDFSAPRLSG